MIPPSGPGSGTTPHAPEKRNPGQLGGTPGVSEEGTGYLIARTEGDCSTVVHGVPQGRKDGTPGVDRGGGERVGGLPCLSSNNSIVQHESNRLSTQHRKAAAALGWNVKAMCERHGIQRVGFLTLTFSDHVTDVKEASKRFNSLASNVLNGRYADWVRVIERQKSQRIHYHLLVAMGEDIRTGVDFTGLANRDYSTAGKALRGEWAFWRSTARKYRFGRTELLPIKSSEEAIGRYVGKYIAKHIEARKEEDKGARLVGYSKGARVAVTRFSWVSPGAATWRRKVRTFAWMMFQSQGIPPTMHGLRVALGPRWAYRWREFILALP